MYMMLRFIYMSKELTLHYRAITRALEQPNENVRGACGGSDSAVVVLVCFLNV